MLFKLKGLKKYVQQFNLSRKPVKIILKYVRSLEMIMFSNKIKMKYFDSFKPQGIYKKHVLYVMVSTVI